MLKGIPPDISYGLQCATETFDITEDVMTFYYRFNEDVSLADLVDNHSLNIDDIKESLRATSRLYYRPYNKWFHTKASALERAWCAASAQRNFSQTATEAIDYHLSNFVSNALKNEFDPLVARYQEQWLDQSRAFKHHEKVAAMMGKKLSLCQEDHLLEAIHNTISYPVIADVLDYDDEVPWGDITETKTEKKNARKARRKVLRRSSEFLRKLIGKEQTTLFIGGNEVKVEGERFIFSVKVNYIYSTSHGALDIRVLEKNSGDYLCNLCWYVSKTPAIDQMAAMILAVQTGDEESIIEIGNAFAVQNETLAKHPQVHDLIQPVNYDPLNLLSELPATGSSERDVFDDHMLDLSKGTHAFLKSNHEALSNFRIRARNRFLRHFPIMSLEYYTPSLVKQDHMLVLS